MLSAEPKAEANYTYRDITHCSEENNDKRTIAKEPEVILLLDMMHCARNLQISQLSASRQLTNLKVALISKISCRLLANEKTDNEYNV